MAAEEFAPALTKRGFVLSKNFNCRGCNETISFSYSNYKLLIINFLSFIKIIKTNKIIFRLFSRLLEIQSLSLLLLLL